MTLTLSHGPLAPDAPRDVNYRIEGPEHRLLFEDFPRRVRALFGGETVFDSRRAKLLHETSYLPKLYVPETDIRVEMLEPSGHRTRCPFKGEASYWSIRVGDRVAENAVWSYPEPLEDAAWLRGYLAFYFGSMDAWLDEDEEIAGHLRDPYHRVDVRNTSRHVRVRADGQVIAETEWPRLLSETGLPNRYYIAPDDVRRDLLEPSATRTVCPYKGMASYHSLRIGDLRVEDIAWTYPEPLESALKVTDHICFSGEGIEIEVDGDRIPAR